VAWGSPAASSARGPPRGKGASGCPVGGFGVGVLHPAPGVVGFFSWGGVMVAMNPEPDKNLKQPQESKQPDKVSKVKEENQQAYQAMQQRFLKEYLQGKQQKPSTERN